MTESPTLVWTPRPPASDEPACWSWPVTPVIDYDAELARLTAENDLKVGDERRDLSAFAYHLDDLATYRFDMFHEGRCAICADEAEVIDHLHEVGMWRGWLCKPCNTYEGTALDPVPAVARYRLWHPAAILDLYEPYTGTGWTDGWSWKLQGAKAGTLGPRPATPWPAWDPALLAGACHDR